MYTQCPDCEVAFRVTASVLQQASGNVRCGSCGHAFNALHFLSEDKPLAAAAKTADPVGDKLAETSRRLLQTLEELSGPEEIIIEDTGVEWRVLDDDDEDGDGSPVLDAPLHEERRYDDNTPLPDDFGEERKEAYQPMTPLRRDADRARLSNEFEDRQGDLALSEPEDWTDLLDEVRDPESDALEVEEELAAIHTQLSAREERLNRESTLVDPDPQTGSRAEAIGLGLGSAEDALTDEVPLLTEADIATRLATSPDDAADDDSEPGAEAIHAGDRVALVEHDRDDAEIDADTRQADDDAAGIEEIDYGEADEDDAAAGIEEINFGEADEDDAAADIEEINFGEADEDDAAADIEEITYGEADDDDAVAGSGEFDYREADDEQWARDDVSRESSGEFEAQIDFAARALRGEDDGKTAAGKVSIRNAEQLFDEHAESVETIIMEGEFVRTAIEDQRIAAESAARSQLDDPLSLADTYATSREKIRGGRRKGDPPSAGMVVGVVLLALLLAGQFIHYSRDSLATFGLFKQTIAPIYDALGAPVTPQWDISAWQFEATNGSVDENNSALTIVSRLANTSAQPLPYPLVHVSLTNRWEDIMGSRILEPADYLAGDLDPARPVLPGEKFTAVITIDDPSADATGFKLNICYRDAPGTVRCAIPDFRN